MELENELSVQAFHVELPVSWRDEKGKADWDGFLAGMVKAKRVT